MVERIVDTPLGKIYFIVHCGKICYVGWKPNPNKNNDNPRFGSMEKNSNIDSWEDLQVLEEAVDWVEGYFAGRIREFESPLDFEGTPFQIKVWEEMMKVPYGQVISYGELARRVGNPKGYRAVANACKVNPFVIIVPCHRIVGSQGIGGYNGGIDKKEYLLELELNESFK